MQSMPVCLICLFLWRFSACGHLNIKALRHRMGVKAYSPGFNGRDAGQSLSVISSVLVVSCKHIRGRVPSQRQLNWISPTDFLPSIQI